MDMIDFFNSLGRDMRHALNEIVAFHSRDGVAERRWRGRLLERPLMHDALEIVGFAPDQQMVPPPVLELDRVRAHHRERLKKIRT